MDETPSEEESVSTGVTTYFYAGSKLLASKNGGELKYNYQDRMGSDIESKSLPFGQEIIKGDLFSFTGKELDKDLYYFGARYYDSNLGKFTSVDPIAGELAYGYVSNNPMNRVDPTGMAGDLVEKGTLVMPSADGWQSINMYSLATYAVENGLDDFNIPAGFWNGAGGSRISALANYYVGFNRREGGADPYSLNIGDVVYFPMSAGGNFNPGDLVAFTSARADSLGLEFGMSSDVAATQTIGGPVAPVYDESPKPIDNGRIFEEWGDVEWFEWSIAEFESYKDGIRSPFGLQSSLREQGIPIETFSPYYNQFVKEGKIRFTDDGRLRLVSYYELAGIKHGSFAAKLVGAHEDTIFHYYSGISRQRADYSGWSNVGE